MGHGKLAKFAEMETFPNVVQETPSLQGGGPLPPSPMQGQWVGFFEKLGTACTPSRALVLELGCGRGEYTVGLARRFPEKNFIGVDIKGARMWHGARQALEERLANAAFLRTHIEFIDRFFKPGEVAEIWLTFSDPQMKKPSKRLTSSFFLERYRRILAEGGLIHLKTDSNFLFTYTLEMLRANHLEPEFQTDDIYNKPCDSVLREVRTYYEQMWLDRGIPIKYLRFHLPQEGTLVEPDVEIPLDEYRSYNRHKRSAKETGR